MGGLSQLQMFKILSAETRPIVEDVTSGNFISKYRGGNKELREISNALWNTSDLLSRMDEIKIPDKDHQ